MTVQMTVQNEKGIVSNSSVQNYSYTCWSQPVEDNTPVTQKIWKLQDYTKGTSKERDEAIKLKRRMLAFEEDSTK